MFKSIITLTIILFCMNICAQDNYFKLPKAAINCPIIIVNDSIISNESMIKSKEHLITQIDVMKYKASREDHEFFNLTENGIVFVNIEKKIKTKSISELNKFFGLDRKSPIYVNGYLLESSSFKIASESIVQIELIMPNEENQLKNKAINVWTLTESQRAKGCQK